MSESHLELNYLSDVALDQIEDTAFRLLDEVGISLQHATATEMLHGLGCRIEKGRVQIQPDVVHQALESVTSNTEVFNSDGSPAFTFGDGRVRFRNGGGIPSTIDLDTGERRPARLQDVADAVRVLDALPQIDVIIPLLDPQDVPARLATIASIETMLRNTRKPVYSYLERPEDVPYIVEMAAACCGGMDAFRERPTMSIYVCPVSPLTFTEKVTSAIIAIAESGAPFHPLPAPSMGATSPITMAGALAQQHAEILASLVIASGTKPGIPVMYCSRIGPIDLRTALSSRGPEVGIAGACAAQLAHRLGMPCDSIGLSTSSAQLDPQFAYERFANAFVPALAGADIVSGVGGLEGGLTGGLEIAVMDNEIISLVKHIIGGCEVNEDTLAFDVMKEVIPGDGVFLGERHTVRQMRKSAIWTPTLSGRQGSSTEDTRTGVVARARARAKEILRTHEVGPLPDGASRALDEILERARCELVGHRNTSQSQSFLSSTGRTQ